MVKKLWLQGYVNSFTHTLYTSQQKKQYRVMQKSHLSNDNMKKKIGILTCYLNHNVCDERFVFRFQPLDFHFTKCVSIFFSTFHKFNLTALYECFKLYSNSKTRLIRLRNGVANHCYPWYFFQGITKKFGSELMHELLL